MLSGRRAVQVEGVTGFKVLKLNPSILQRLFLKQFASTWNGPDAQCAGSSLPSGSKLASSLPPSLLPSLLFSFFL